MPIPSVPAGTYADDTFPDGSGDFITFLNTIISAVNTNTSGVAAALVKSSNLSDLTNAATARTNLGLGGAAVLSVGTTAGTVAAGDDSRITGAAQKSSNLSDLASAATARSNLGLGSIATASSSAYAATANNLSDLASAATARSNLGLGTMATQASTSYAALASANTFTRGQFVDGSSDEIQLRVQGHSTQTTDFLRVENSAGTKLGGWDRYGQLNTQYVTDTTGTSPYLWLTSSRLLAVNQGTVSNVVFTARGMASQTGDLFRAEDSANTVLASINSAGKGFFADVATSSGGTGTVYTQYVQYGAGTGPYIQLTSTNGTISVKSRNTGEIPLTINAVSGQTAKLLSLQVNGSELAYVDSAGCLVTKATATGSAGLRIPSGTAPTSPVAGDLYFDGTNLKFYTGSATKTITWS